MKLNFKFALILSLFALFVLSSCQDEVLQETQNPEETILPDSAVANAMRSAAANNGALDNILDGTDCFSINLPVTIIANGITITIDSLEDLEILEEIFDEFGDDEDLLEFFFPITVILNDYTEIVIENEDQLEAFIEECTSPDDDVIECVDFVYPISFSIYNSAFQIIDTVVIENDEALYDFLEELEENNDGGAILASLNFPVTLIYSDGSTIEVNSNQELQNALNAADEFCEDDEDFCDAETVGMYLLECHWEVASFNGDDNLAGYDLYFGQDGTVEITFENSTENILGNWELSETDSGLILTITELTGLDSDLGGDWLVIVCEDDYIKITREEPNSNSITYVVLERECEDDLDCSAQEVNYNLIECVWYSGSNAGSNDFNGPFDFNENGTVTVVVPNGNVVTGQWNITLTDEGIILVLLLPEPYAELSGEWALYECDENRLKFFNGDYYIVLEQDCSNDDYCEEWQSYVGDECETPDGLVGSLNENCECVVQDEFDCPDYEANVGDPCENPNGIAGILDENCNCVTDTAFDCPDQQANFGDECEDAAGNLGFINENCECEVDTTAFECYSNTELVKCDDDVADGFTAFDLNFAYPNCVEDNVELSYHESLADAEAGVEALSSPYTNISNPQIIYARVVLAGTTIYEVFEVHLFVENCNQDTCSIGAIEDYLLTCEWIPVSVDGSDDFSTVYMNFQENGELIVEGLGLAATGNWMLVENSSGGVVLQISGFNNLFQVFIGEWLVAQCTPTELILLNNVNNNQILLQQECN
ncbi:MAG: hypothetical protein KJO25_05735 [Bacteroidia bacterium]|nr:hypothetical protein [Bacteroidia bacterium]